MPSLIDRFTTLFRRQAGAYSNTPQRTTSAEVPPPLRPTADIRRFQVERDRRSIVALSRRMVDEDTRADGVIKTAVNVSVRTSENANQTSGQILSEDEIFVNDVKNDDPGQAFFDNRVDTGPYAGTGALSIGGSGGTWTFSDSFRQVLITNHWNKPLRINNIDVVTEVLTSRLTDVIREELGESYSPYAFTFLNSDPDPLVQTYMQITGSPKRIASVADLVVAELDDLAANGPSDSEFQGAFAQVQESYQFVDNNTFLEELINDAIFPDRELQDYFDQFTALAGVNPDTVRQFIADHVGTEPGYLRQAAQTFHTRFAPLCVSCPALASRRSPSWLCSRRAPPRSRQSKSCPRARPSTRPTWTSTGST